MKNHILAFVCAVLPFFLVCYSAKAQVDTLYGTERWVTGVKVTTVSNHEVLAKSQEGSAAEESLKIPLAKLDSLRFADGFTIRFHNGVLERGNLLQAPRYKASFTRVKAEGVLPLNQEEIRQYYGPWNYELVYKPYRNQMVTGITKTVVGLSVGHFIFGKYLEWYNGFVPEVYYVDSEHDFDPRSRHFEEKVTPVPAAAVAFLGGMAVSGLVDCGVSAIGQRRLNKYGDQLATPSASSAKTLFWSGVALSATGLTAMVLSYRQLDAHRFWEIRVYPNENGNVERPHSQIPGWVPYALFGGAVAANLGFSAIQLGQTRLSAIRRLDGSVYGAEWHLGPTSSGYGLAASF